MKSDSDSFTARVRAFFFTEEVPYGAALVRIFLPLAALIPMVARWSRVRELYSTEGTSVQLSESYGVGAWLPVAPPAIAVALYSIMIVCLLSGVAGWKTRLSLAIGTLLYFYFNFLDTIGTLTKYSVLATHLLLMLTLSNAGAVWSVDAFLKRRQQGGHANVIPPKFPVWPACMMQLVFAYMYFGAGITKIQTDAFFSGEQMRYWMLSNWNYENPLGEMMAMWSPLLLISAYITVVWEIVFAFLVWKGKARLVILGVGATFHLGTWLLLGLWVFPAICISGYLAFVREHDVVRVRRWLRRLTVIRTLRTAVSRGVNGLADRMPTPVPPAVAWTLLVCVSAIAGTEAEYRLDLYGERRIEGPLPLAMIPREEALPKISDKRPLREKDKFFSFDLGSLSIGGQLANRRSEFTFGERILAQCNLNPPHEDMWVECVLEDDQQRIIERFGQFVTREMLRANFEYYIGNRLIPGQYEIVLRSSGQDIYRRRFQLTGTPTTESGVPAYLTN